VNDELEGIWMDVVMVLFKTKDRVKQNDDDQSAGKTDRETFKFLENCNHHSSVVWLPQQANCHQALITGETRFFLTSVVGRHCMIVPKHIIYISQPACA
jgi:hypothetical protein